MVLSLLHLLTAGPLFLPDTEVRLPVPVELRGRPCYYDRWRVAHCAARGEHIVFMGDSLTRYQWLALAASFHSGVELGVEFPSLVKEQEWRHWMPFFNGSMARLGPNSKCDCHRTFARPVGSKSIENRYFWLPERGMLNMSFIQVLNPESILGHWAPTAPLDDERHRSTIHEEFAPLWRMRWADTISNVVAKMLPKPTVLVLNMGMWGPPPNASYLADILQLAQRAAPRVLWKTTTRMRKAGPTKWLRTDLLARRVFPEIFDAARLTRGLSARDYWDPFHVLPHVYNHLNAALLRQVYGPPKYCEDFNHGRCTRSGPAPRPGEPAVSTSEAERAAVVAEATPGDGWAGVQTRPPPAWSPLHTLMWVDATGLTHDPKLFANKGVNGSTLLELVSQSRLSEVGIASSAARRVLASQLALITAQHDAT